MGQRLVWTTERRRVVYRVTSGPTPLGYGYGYRRGGVVQILLEELRGTPDTCRNKDIK